MEDSVIELLLKLKMNKSLSLEQIAEKLNLTNKEELEELKDILDDYEKKCEIYRTDLNTYKHMSKTSFRRGIFHANKAGGGKVLVVTSYEKDGEQHVLQKEFIVRAENANGAIDNDEVLIDINLRNSSDLSAKVYKVIGRDLSRVYGKIETKNGNKYVIPLDKKLKNINIIVEGNYLDGEIVEVRLDQQTANNFYIGNVIRTGNFHDDPKKDILMEAFINGIDANFSKESVIQSDKLPDKVIPTDFIGRQDLREEETFTIDSKTTNDIDDAVSIKILPNGNFELTVSIADVTHYVPFNSPLDLDARRKATSNYLAGTVIPMLPRKLSNGICSLNPNVERCAMSIRMEIDRKGNVVRKDLFPSVIKSDIKMDYETVNNILYNKYNDNDFPIDYKAHEMALQNMYKLALILRSRRIKKGAVEFNRPELKIILDENGVPIRIDKRVQDIAENLIEEFMIVANVSVFSLLDQLGIPCDFRVHDVPKEDKLIEFFNLLDLIGIPYDKYSPEECMSNSKALQDLVIFINTKADPSQINMLNNKLIRCMSRAKYSVINIGHNGLAEPVYGHFTSPIRRYPDFTIHRIIKDCYFDVNNANKNIRKWEKLLPEICYHSSKMEKVADTAERDVDAMKTAEYMEKAINQEFVGTIIDISGNGLTIQLDNMIEGRVRCRNLVGEYMFNPETFSLLSKNGGEDYFLGDQVKVVVKDANKEKKLIDFKVVEKIRDNSTKDIRSRNELAKLKEREREINKQERKKVFSKEFKRK